MRKCKGFRAKKLHTNAEPTFQAPFWTVVYKGPDSGFASHWGEGRGWDLGFMVKDSDDGFAALAAVLMVMMRMMMVRMMTMRKKFFDEACF